MGSLFGLIVSTGYIVLSCLIAWWARKLADKLCPKLTTPKCLLLEGIATWELCSTCFELIIVADNYGVLTYAAYLFLLTIWWSQKWGDSSACPYTHIEQVVEGGEGTVVAVAKILAELAGGALTYRYAQYLWSLEVSATHRGRAYEACEADLKVPVLLGALIEGTATCLCRLVSRIISDLRVPYGHVADAFFGTALVVAAFSAFSNYVAIIRTMMAKRRLWLYLQYKFWLLQAAYFIICTINDILGPKEKHTGEPTKLCKVKDYIECSMAFPISVFVGFTFWSLMAVDRELVLPKALDPYFPGWLNHVMHTNILIFQFLEMVTTKREYPPRKWGLIGLSVFQGLYLTWMHIVYYVSGLWAYPILTVLNLPLRILFLTASFMTGFLFYFLGEYFNRFLWGKSS